MTLVLLFGKRGGKGRLSNRVPNTFPKNLKNLFRDLESKGYNPQSTSNNAKEKFVTFSITSGVNPVVVKVNEANEITFTSADIKEPFKVKYDGRSFMANKKIVAESSDMISGILQIIENRDFL